MTARTYNGKNYNSNSIAQQELTTATAAARTYNSNGKNYNSNGKNSHQQIRAVSVS